MDEGPDNGRRHPLVVWLTHRWYSYWIVLYLLGIFFTYFNLNIWIILVTDGIWIALYFWSFTSHARGLCLRCMELAPHDPQTAVNREMRSLRLAHVLEDRNPLWFLPIIFGWVIWSAIIGLACSQLIDDHGLVYAIVEPLIAFPPLLYFDRAMKFHNWLRPWCPMCKPWDDGGAPEPSPTPDPSGAKTG